VHAGLGRHFHAALALFVKHAFQRANDLGHRKLKLTHISLGQV
jgi:hypothetical protein